MQDPMIELLSKIITKKNQQEQDIMVWKVIQDLEELIGESWFDAVSDINVDYNNGAIDAYTHCIKLMKTWILGEIYNE